MILVHNVGFELCVSFGYVCLIICFKCMTLVHIVGFRLCVTFGYAWLIICCTCTILVHTVSFSSVIVLDICLSYNLLQMYQCDLTALVLG